MNQLAITITYTRLFHIISVMFDIVSISYFFISFFYLETPLIAFEIFLGCYFLIEYTLLLMASENRWEYVKHPLALSNILIIIGYLVAPFWNLGVLRILRALRVIHLYQIIPDIRLMTDRVALWERVLALFFHFCVLLFVISEIVFIAQADINADITSRFDAFYFTANIITQASSGIQLVGSDGRLITLFITFLSISVFMQIWDTARDVRRFIGQKKKMTKNQLQEIYSEQYCTYCDIKNREKLRKTI